MSCGTDCVRTQEILVPLTYISHLTCSLTIDSSVSDEYVGIPDILVAISDVGDCSWSTSVSIRHLSVLLSLHPRMNQATASL